MNIREARILIFISLTIGIGLAVAAQVPDQRAASTSTPVTAVSATATATTASPATAATAPASSSAEVLKQARLAGYQIRKSPQGATVFCKKETHVGSRFSTDSCIDEPQLQEFLIRAKDQQDKLQHRRGTGTNAH